MGQNRDLVCYGKKLVYSGSLPEDSCSHKSPVLDLREGFGYLGKVRKFQQPKTNTFCKKNSGEGQIDLLPPQQEKGSNLSEISILECRQHFENSMASKI